MTFEEWWGRNYRDFTEMRMPERFKRVSLLTWDAAKSDIREEVEWFKPNVMSLLAPGMLNSINRILGGKTAVWYESFEFDGFCVRTDHGSAKIKLQDLERWFNNDDYQQIKVAAKECAFELLAKDHWWPFDPFENRAA